jgi:hypothetical protein
MIGRRYLWLAQRVVAPFGLAVEAARAVRTRVEIASFQQRRTIVRRFPGPKGEQSRPRVLAVVTHVADSSRPRDAIVDRLAQTIDGLVESLGHTQLNVVVNTLPGLHVTDELAAHQEAMLELHDAHQGDPMFLGFEAQNEFVRRADEADWFLYLEDDLVLGDALLLEKLEYFNSGAPEGSLLLPHRYELWKGRKFYVDFMSKTRIDQDWNRLTRIDVGDWQFVEFENPHSGCYCLSRTQLERWIATGRHWSGLSSFSGPRESAATGCLAESFRLYKPLQATYLEIRHQGSKYAELYSRIHVFDEAATR